MKIFTWFLSSIILIITCITCGDISEVSTPEKNQISNTISKNQAHANEDNCSPLCTCNCCGQPLVFLQKPLGLDFSRQEIAALNEPDYQNIFASGFLNNIWQPPKYKLNSIG